MINTSLRVAIPSYPSKLHGPVITLLGLDLDHTDSRLTFFSDRTRMFLLRGWDIPAMVTRGFVHYGLCGFDCICESKSHVNIIEKLSLRQSRIALCCRENSSHILSNGATIATEYPHLCSEYLERKGLTDCRIIQIKGAAEAVAYLPEVDFVIDLLTSGLSARTNGLVAIEELMFTDVCMIETRAIEVPHRLVSSDELKERLLDDFATQL